MKWKCHIPGKANTDWDGGYFPLTMEFSEDYPAKPPKVGLCLCCNALSKASLYVMCWELVTQQSSGADLISVPLT